MTLDEVDEECAEVLDGRPAEALSQLLLHQSTLGKSSLPDAFDRSG